MSCKLGSYPMGEFGLQRIRLMVFLATNFGSMSICCLAGVGTSAMGTVFLTLLFVILSGGISARKTASATQRFGTAVGFSCHSVFLRPCQISEWPESELKSSEAFANRIF